jgi:hypothetical protein
MALKGNKQYIATETFETQDAFVQRGVTRVREGHPLLKAYPDWFAPVDEIPAHYETAASSPGAPRD